MENIYIVFKGKPGVGKGITLKKVWKLLAEEGNKVERDYKQEYGLIVSAIKPK